MSSGRDLQNLISNFNSDSRQPLFDGSNVDNVANDAFYNIISSANRQDPEQTRLLSGSSTAPFNQKYLSQYFNDTKGLTNQSQLDNIGSSTYTPQYLSEQLRNIGSAFNTNNPDYDFYRPGAAEISRQGAAYGGDRESRRRSRASSNRVSRFDPSASKSGNYLDQDSLASRGITSNKGFKGIESGLSNLYFSPPDDINSDFTAGASGNARYGGRDLSFLGQGTFNSSALGNQSSENYADRLNRVGAAGGYIYDSSGYNSTNANFDFNNPYEYSNSAAGNVQTGPGTSQYYSNTAGFIDPNLQTPDPNSFSYNQAIDSSIAGASQIGSQNQLLGNAGASGNTQAQTNQLNPIQLATDPLGALLTSRGTIVTQDSAQAGSQANNAALSGGTLSAPGTVNMGQSNAQANQTNTTSPIFGNEATAGTSTNQTSQQGLSVGSQGGQASAGSAIQQAANANEGIDQTRVQVLPGIIPIGGSDNTYQFVNSNSNVAQQAKNESGVATTAPSNTSGSSMADLEALLSGGAQATSNQQGSTSANTGYTNATTNANLQGSTGAAGQGTTADQNQASAGSSSAESVTLQNSVTPNDGGLPGAIIGGVAGSVPIVGGALSSLAGLLFGTTKVEQDNANASSNAAVSNQGNINITNPGAAQVNTSGQASSQASSTSPIFENQVNTAAGVDVSGNTSGIVGPQGGSASAGTNANILANADGSIDQTRTTTNGLMTGFGNKSVNVVDQDLNTGITGTAGANVNLSGNAQAQANQTANANASAQNIINGANDVGLNSNLNLTSSQNVSGTTAGNNTSLVGSANSAFAAGQQGAQNNTALTNTANLIANLQGSDASTSGVSSAQSALSGTQGADVKSQVEIQAKSFISDLEKALPQTEDSATIIARLKQDPSLVWLFDGKNSPKSVLQALASSTTTSQGGYITPNRGFFGDGNELITNAANLEAGIKIDPNSTANIQRYYTDPQSGRTFANVGGQVREVSQGQFVPIDYRDEFTLKALSQSTLGPTSGDSAANGQVEANLMAQGRIKGQQYLFQGTSGDPIYDAMANEAIARLNNSYQQGQVDPYAQQITELLGLTSGQMYNGKDYSYYQPVVDALRQQRAFDAQRGLTLGGSVIDLDNIDASGKAFKGANIEGYGSNNSRDYATTNWDESGVTRDNWGTRRAEYNRGYSGRTSGDNNLYSSLDFDVNGLNASQGKLQDLINQDQYGPLDLRVRAAGAYSTFVPIKYHNDGNSGRLEGNRWRAADSARQSIADGSIQNIGLSNYGDTLTAGGNGSGTFQDFISSQEKEYQNLISGMPSVSQYTYIDRFGKPVTNRSTINWLDNYGEGRIKAGAYKRIENPEYRNYAENLRAYSDITGKYLNI